MNKRCGYVAIVGRPNVGKSTLLNLLVGYKISAIANKPQTTRTNIRGILTEDYYQLIFTDTPGIHQQSKNLLNMTLNSEAVASLEAIDAVVMVVEALKWTDEDELALKRLKHLNVPVFLLVNKVDRVTPKERLFPYLEKVAAKYAFKEIIPGSATSKININKLTKALVHVMPEDEWIHDEDSITDQSVRSICAELIREQLVVNLHQELPYFTAVNIERFEETEKFVEIDATIWVARESQKGIIIGKKGETLKRIGTGSRHSIEEFLGKKVVIKQWVKLEEDWQNNPHLLQELGIMSNR